MCVCVCVCGIMPPFHKGMLLFHRGRQVGIKILGLTSCKGDLIEEEGARSLIQQLP